MNDKQPEALRLAAWLYSLEYAEAEEAADELRRLHDLLGKANALARIRHTRIQKLEAVNVQLLEALKRVLHKAYKQNWNDNYPDEVALAEAAIEAASDETSR